MKRYKLLFATAGIILAGAGALDILGDQSVPADTVRIASVADAAQARSVTVDHITPRTVSCPIDSAAFLRPAP